MTRRLVILTLFVTAAPLFGAWLILHGDRSPYTMALFLGGALWGLSSRTCFLAVRDSIRSSRRTEVTPGTYVASGHNGGAYAITIDSWLGRTRR